MRLSIAQRFESKVMYEPNTGCWLWTGALNNNSYGRLAIDNINKLAHRISYQIYKGEIPKDMLVCHHCDIPSCVNPDHLFLGTDLDNATDRMNKGRFRSLHGEENGSSKLTELQVREILTSSERNKDVAKRLDVSKQMVSQIRKRKIWKHVSL